VKSGKVTDLTHLPSYFALAVSKTVNRHGIGNMQAFLRPVAGAVKTAPVEGIPEIDRHSRRGEGAGVLRVKRRAERPRLRHAASGGQFLGYPLLGRF
jgi:hypothetical protein